MRKHIVAGNWKMNLNATTAASLVSEVMQMVQAEYTGDTEVIFAPSFPFLAHTHHLIKDASRFHLAGQTLHEQPKGAYTGDVSATMLTSVGASFVIIGHSECRRCRQESNELLAKKIDIALHEGLRPIYCIGETLEEREAGNTLSVNEVQMKEGAFHLTAEQFGQLVIAYEPVWAIGTGKTASPEQAQEVHKAIRTLIADQYGAEVADHTTILYGGSVKPANAAELFAQPDIDGGLVGGASLKSRDFTDIIKAH